MYVETGTCAAVSFLIVTLMYMVPSACLFQINDPYELGFS